MILAAILTAGITLSGNATASQLESDPEPIFRFEERNSYFDTVAQVQRELGSPHGKFGDPSFEKVSKARRENTNLLRAFERRLEEASYSSEDLLKMAQSIEERIIPPLPRPSLSDKGILDMRIKYLERVAPRYLKHLGGLPGALANIDSLGLGKPLFAMTLLGDYFTPRREAPGEHSREVYSRMFALAFRSWRDTESPAFYRADIGLVLWKAIQEHPELFQRLFSEDERRGWYFSLRKLYCETGQENPQTFRLSLILNAVEREVAPELHQADARRDFLGKGCLSPRGSLLKASIRETIESESLGTSVAYLASHPDTLTLKTFMRSWSWEADTDRIIALIEAYERTERRTHIAEDIRKKYATFLASRAMMPTRNMEIQDRYEALDPLLLRDPRLKPYFGRIAEHLDTRSIASFYRRFGIPESAELHFHLSRALILRGTLTQLHFAEHRKQFTRLPDSLLRHAREREAHLDSLNKEELRRDLLHNHWR